MPRTVFTYEIKTKGEAYNIGSTKYYSIKEIFDIIKKITGSSVKLEIDKRFRPDNLRLKFYLVIITN